MASHNYILAYSSLYALMSKKRMPLTAVNNASLVKCKATDPSFTAVTVKSPEPPLRPSANYQPNKWDYNSIKSLDSAYVHVITAEQFENKLVARLQLIDDVERLGLGHHFEEEIMHALTSISDKSDHVLEVMKEDLHAIALFFKLLRQHGLDVSQDIFSHFKDEKGSFRVSLQNDVQGLLSLYEASFLGFDGENTLEEARDFTTEHLLNLMPFMHPHLKHIVERSLELPLHWRTPRLEARWYIHQYKNSENMNPSLLLLAKLDFNLKEFKKMINWLIVLGLGERTSFARDRLVECFFYAVGIVFDPQHGLCREELTKVMTLIIILDDVYDVYGSLDELQLFTRAVERWECDGSEGLPAYMKILYNSIYNSAEELANKIQKIEGRDAMPYIGKAWADLCKAFLKEAEWHYSGYKPSLEEYLNNGWMSASGNVILVHVFLSSEQGKTKEGLQHLMNYPNLIKSSSMIFRLLNDIATSAAELERGDTPTSIHCYMIEYNMTEDQAPKKVWNLIDKSWKELNEGLANCSPLSLFFGIAAMNLARVMHYVYQYGDGHGAPDQDKENQIKSLFFMPIKLDDHAHLTWV
ncbi:(+)-alpha-terpineol synthase protein [Dioscorea alata]|uniref:(+)-alpha-terpineol synthase protein n=1 Tax=Dioscorea alata TaxID=55571 RepID=A0ACB7VNL7_DIOAL|nr:(+)-alpha-terpineol synthase protein [Dioscorea alata]